jgi:pyrroloquinoline-quinone synthase
MQLYRNFMLAIGETPNLYPDTDIIPELCDYIDTMMRLTQHGHWIAAVGAVGIASEWPIPHYYHGLLQGLQGIQGINAQDLELFSGHIELDLEHARMIEQALLPHLEETSGRALLLEGIECNLNARMHLMTGLDRVVFG